MNTALYIVLGIVVGVVLTPLLLWIAFKLFVYFFLKRLAKAFGLKGAGMPVMRLESGPLDDEHEWIDSKLIDRLTKELESLGFEQAGDFILYTSPMVNVRGFACPTLKAYAMVNDWDRDLLNGMGVTLDLFACEASHPEGSAATSYTVSNAPETALDKPGWKRKVHLDIDINNARLAVDTLITRWQEFVSAAELRPVSAESFLPSLKQEYNREMDWYIERGGPNKEELRRNLLLFGGEDQDEESIEGAIEMEQTQWGIAIHNFVSEEIRKRFINHVTKMSAGEWEDTRDRLYIVHEKSHPTLLIGRISQEMFPDDPEDDADYEAIEAGLNQKLEPLFTSTPPREAFEKALGMLPEERSFKRLARIKSPWPADVYLEPEDPEYD